MSKMKDVSKAKSENGVHPNRGSIFEEDTITEDDTILVDTTVPEKWAMDYDPEATFPEVPVGLGLTVQITWVTPEIAADWLKSTTVRQRPIKKAHLASLMRDHLSGWFLLNGEPIVFDSQGNMINGQHRCRMVIETQKPMLTFVARGFPSVVYETFDRAAKRGTGDALAAIGVSDSINVASALVIYEHYRLGILGKQIRVFSPKYILDLFDKNPGIAGSMAVVSTGLRNLGSRSALAACHYVLSSINKNEAAVFFDSLKTLSGLREGDPILALYGRLHNSSLRPAEMVGLIFKAWNYWRKKRPSTALRINPGEPIPKPI